MSTGNIYKDKGIYGEFRCRIGQANRCMENGCAFYHTGSQACHGYEKEKKFYVKGEDSLIKESAKKFLKSADHKSHIWVGSKTGVVTASNRDFKPRGKKGERFKYLGCSKDITFPITLNTGRILKKPKAKKKKLS